MKIKLVIFFCIISVVLQAQQEPLQYSRPNNKMGINVFESTKNDTTFYKSSVTFVRLKLLIFNTLKLIRA